MAVDLGVTLYDDGDLSSDMRQVSGIESLGLALQRRLSTSRGSLWYDRDYGTNLCDFIHQAGGAYPIEQATETECLKDERVESVSASATQDGSEIELAIVVTTSNGEFRYVLEVSSVTVDLLRFEAA